MPDPSLLSSVDASSVGGIAGMIMALVQTGKRVFKFDDAWAIALALIFSVGLAILYAASQHHGLVAETKDTLMQGFLWFLQATGLYKLAKMDFAQPIVDEIKETITGEPAKQSQPQLPRQLTDDAPGTRRGEG